MKKPLNIFQYSNCVFHYCLFQEICVNALSSYNDSAILILCSVYNFVVTCVYIYSYIVNQIHTITLECCVGVLL